MSSSQRILFVIFITNCIHAMASFRPPRDVKRWTVSFDGSLVNDKDFVYVLGFFSRYGKSAIQQIDYIHTKYRVDGIPLAYMVDKTYIITTHMISIAKGFTVQRIINLQRRWRLRRSRNYAKHMLRFCLAVARKVRNEKSYT